MRATLRLSSPAWFAQPKKTSSISPGRHAGALDGRGDRASPRGRPAARRRARRRSARRASAPPRGRPRGSCRISVATAVRSGRKPAAGARRPRRAAKARTVAARGRSTNSRLVGADRRRDRPVRGRRAAPRRRPDRRAARPPRRRRRARGSRRRRRRRFQRARSRSCPSTVPVAGRERSRSRPRPVTQSEPPNEAIRSAARVVRRPEAVARRMTAFVAGSIRSSVFSRWLRHPDEGAVEPKPAGPSPTGTRAPRPVRRRVDAKRAPARRRRPPRRAPAPAQRYGTSVPSPICGGDPIRRGAIRNEDRAGRATAQTAPSPAAIDQTGTGKRIRAITCPVASRDPLHLALPAAGDPGRAETERERILRVGDRRAAADPERRGARKRRTRRRKRPRRTPSARRTSACQREPRAASLPARGNASRTR